MIPTQRNLQASPASSKVRPSDSLHLVCPACGRNRVKGLVPSERGAYCVCQCCGHKWQQEGLRISWRDGEPENPGRRKTDRSRGRLPDGGATDAPAEGIPCSHCGRIDEGHQRTLRHLAERVAKLEAENALLRDSSRSFGELADRLNQQLRREPGSAREERCD